MQNCGHHHPSSVRSCEWRREHDESRSWRTMPLSKEEEPETRWLRSRKILMSYDSRAKTSGTNYRVGRSCFGCDADRVRGAYVQPLKRWDDHTT